MGVHPSEPADRPCARLGTVFVAVVNSALIHANPAAEGDMQTSERSLDIRASPLFRLIELIFI
jgi:hypothetical protein